MNIFKNIVQGESFTWRDDATTDNLGNNVDSSEYTLTYEIRGATVLTLTASAYDTGWETSITTTQSGALSPSVYYWQAFATKTGKKILLGQGSFEVKQSLATVTKAYDGRSQTEKDLEAVRAAIRTFATGGAVQEYTIGNRSLKKMALNDLIVLEQRLKYDLNLEKKAEKISNGEGDPRNLYIRFNPTGGSKKGRR